MDYAGLRDNVVIPALRNAGVLVVVRRMVDSYTPATGVNTQTVVESTVSAVISDYDLSAIDEVLVRRGDRRVLIAGISPPRPGDEVVMGGDAYRVVAVRALSPALVDVLYDVQVRR